MGIRRTKRDYLRYVVEVATNEQYETEAVTPVTPVDIRQLFGSVVEPISLVQELVSLAPFNPSLLSVGEAQWMGAIRLATHCLGDLRSCGRDDNVINGNVINGNVINLLLQFILRKEKFLNSPYQERLVQDLYDRALQQNFLQFKDNWRGIWESTQRIDDSTGGSIIWKLLSKSLRHKFDEDPDKEKNIESILAGVGQMCDGTYGLCTKTTFFGFLVKQMKQLDDPEKYLVLWEPFVDHELRKISRAVQDTHQVSI